MFFGKVEGKILDFYFNNPSREEHVNGLAKVLKIGAGSASVNCQNLFKRDFLLKKEKGNSLFYSLNNENVLVKKLKTLWFLGKLMNLKKEWNHESFISVALYGSYASGEFMEKSDVDILVITNAEDNLVYEKFRAADFSLWKDVMPVVFSVAKWMDLARKKDRFYLEVISNHVLLSGRPIVVG